MKKIRLFSIKNITRQNKKTAALLLAALLSLMTVFPYLPPFQFQAAENDGLVTLTTAYGDFGGDHKLYCIDKGGLAIWGIAVKGDQYEKHSVKNMTIPLSEKEQEYIFWGILTLQASLGIREAANAVERINHSALEQGKKVIDTFITEEDLKALIYRSDVRAKYSWLETAAENTEEYLEMAGLTGNGAGETVSGKNVPDILLHSTSQSGAFPVSFPDYTIHFDESGADADFILTVPLLCSNDGGVSYSETPPDGWTYSKTETSISFYNPNPEPPEMLIKFAVEGTEYAGTSGFYESKEDMFEQCLQFWECVKCSGTHSGGTPAASAPEIHQRMVWMELKLPQTGYYAAVGGAPMEETGKTALTFRIFRHAEDFTANYNLRMYKYDHETGKPLDGARFVLYERFDDQAQIDQERDGPAHIYEGGEPYASFHTDSPAVWDGFRKIGTVVTGEDGCAEQTVSHGYHYDKTFCDGHPAPVFVEVPNPKEDEETGEILNEDSIEGARAANQAVAKKWLDTVSDCEAKAEGEFEGVHFHWIMEEVNQEEIENTADSGGEEGTAPDGGSSEEPDAASAYEKSGCFQDMLDTYDRFISLKYSYGLAEFQAREGYVRHGVHADDLPVEIITTDSSENGANSFFSGEYSDKDMLEAQSSRFAAMAKKITSGKKQTDISRTEEIQTSESEERQTVLYQKAKQVSQKILSFIFSDKEEDEERKKDGAEEAQTEETEGNSEEVKKEEEENEKNAKPEVSARQSYPVSFVCPFATPSTPSEAWPLDEEEEEDGNEEFSAEEEPLKENAGPATLSDAEFRWSSGSSGFQQPRAKSGEEKGVTSLFPAAYEKALVSESEGALAEPGPDYHYSHCNDEDGEGNAWRIYDHRTEAEFHINKKDLDLAAGQSERYDAYGDTQGDTSLEGAVYGLFAAEDIFHPDGKTGVVYKANNLAAVAATDRDGNASFLVNTEAPGRTYDYKTGQITDTADGWAGQAPQNLYTADVSYDDYTADKAYERSYRNNEENNGNCWIGRPLLLGEYYVKELSRSEGYELSVGNKSHNLTNRGQDLEAEAPAGGKGYAIISKPLYAEEQAEAEGEGARQNELFFSARSKDTEKQQYDIVLSGLPEGTEIYRKETGTKEIEVAVGTGNYEKVPLTNPDGTPKYVTAANDYQYPKYREDGTLMTREVPVNIAVSGVRQVPVRGLDEDASIQAVCQKEEGMTAEEIREKLEQPFTEDDFLFVKGKTEKALRRNAKGTPGIRQEDGEYAYSSIYEGVFDRGVREGQTDETGISGVSPNSPAASTVYGSPVRMLTINKTKADGSSLTAGDAVFSILDYYNSHPYYSYGGIDAVEEKKEEFLFTVYAGVEGNPENFMVLGSDARTDSIIYHAVYFLSEDTSVSPRIIYGTYSNNPEYGAFGTYRDYREQALDSSVLASATLVTDAVSDEYGNLRSKTIQENVYYKTGETVLDKNGNPIQEYEYREIVKTETWKTEEIKWQKIPSEWREDGTCVVPVQAAYTDSFGVSHTNEGTDQTISFKAVLKEKQMILSEEEADFLNSQVMDGFQAGDSMGSASYFVHVKRAVVKAYPDYGNDRLTGEDTYTIPASLYYPGQEQVYEDGETRNQAAQVFERPVRQRVKVVKEVETGSEGGGKNNTYGYKAEKKVPGFRFKAYLKSNLERLYRAQDGTVVWMDRNGNIISYEELMESSYPERLPGRTEKINVPKLFTKVLHDTSSSLTSINGNNILSAYQDPETADQNSALRLPFDTSMAPGGIGVFANAALYSYRGRNENTGRTPKIRGEANRGFTRILEIKEQTVKNGAESITVHTYNYDKFFQAMQAANIDKWDEKHQTYTSWKPLENGKKRTEYAVNNAKASDMVRQFAIDWYLDDEAAKLLKDNGQKEDEVKKAEEENLSSGTLYDEALNNALIKAYDYLKPFFQYDLDQVYAVAWDKEADGGEDHDPDTVCADTESEKEGEESCFGLSAYLPYGTYVIVEQQPVKELANKHYRLDSPKEIQIPSVYEAGTQGTGQTGRLSKTYQYDAKQSLNDQAAEENFLIRFGEEWDKNAAEQREYVIRAHSHDGDFEVYKYGLEPDKLTGSVNYDGKTWDYSGFSITQEEYDPLKDYYNQVHRVNGRNLTKEEGANENSHYFADDNNKGQTAGNGKPYAPDAIEARYNYGSVSEQAGKAGSVLCPDKGEETGEHNSGGSPVYTDARTMQGVQTAYDGLYAPMLVPYSMLDPVNGMSYDPSEFRGYGEGNFCNTFYAARLRIEKLDSETHENLLHDGALFMIYRAARDEETGEARFYEEDTLLTGSEEFLKAMGASGIRPLSRENAAESVKNEKTSGPGMLYCGTVKEGTPVCREEDRVILSDAQGRQVGTFKAFSTVNDVSMKNEDTNQAPKEFRLQTTGILTTPEPLGAGVYVLAEVPPKGYVRTAPIAVEIYSDKVTYYKEGKRDQRVHSAIYEERGVNGNEAEGIAGFQTDTAGIYVENIPIRLQVEKRKMEGTVTFRIGERVDGSLTEIGGNPKLQYAYDENGVYLGYAYPKGTLERLAALKEAGEQVEIVYDGNHFAGYGYVTRVRSTDDDENPYVAGAKLTLFDAIELIPSGDSGDLAYQGLSVKRSLSNQVTSMTVKQGYAGQKTELIKETDDRGNPILADYVTEINGNGEPVTKKGYVWKEGTVERPETEILYYDLSGLSLTWTEQAGGKRVRYGWDRNHQKVAVDQIQADRANYEKTDREPSIFAFQGGQPFLELAGGDLTKVSYDPLNKILKGDFASLQRVTASGGWKMGEGTRVYHLDQDGNRDAMADPYTGMAYILEPKLNGEGVHMEDRVLVWPVETARDKNGAVTARDKITTSRIATIGENQDGYGEEEVLEPINQTGQVIADSEKPSYSHRESGYINGTWSKKGEGLDRTKEEGAEESHTEETVIKNGKGQNLNGEILSGINNGSFLNFMSPVYDEHGLVLYYQRNSEIYDKGTELYDRNGDFVRYKNSDNLEEYNDAAYALDDHEVLYDGKEEQEHQKQDRLYHRKGESYILENTWLTSDRTPNDPFQSEEMAGQPDLIKRLPAGTYILEELSAPKGEGYIKSFPVGVTVEESVQIKKIQVQDDTTKTYFEKIDGTEEGTEPASCYGNCQLPGAKLALYPARYVADPASEEGYRLEKTSQQPFCLEITDSRAGAEKFKEMAWTTKKLPLYAEGLPPGWYILEEASAPSGFIKSDPVNIRIDATGEIQNFCLYNDHTKVAFKKYTEEGKDRKVLSGAAFTLYEAETDEDGNAVYDETGIPLYREDSPVESWVSDDASCYTKTIDLREYPNMEGKKGQTGFTLDFERMYEEYGIHGQRFTWHTEQTAVRDSRDSKVWKLQDGSRVTVGTDEETGKETVTFPPQVKKEDREGFKAAYAAMTGEKLTLQWAVSRTARVTDAKTLDASLAGGKEKKYPDVAKLTLKVQETEKIILADIRFDGTSFEYSYKFDYNRLSHINNHANSWLTSEGSRRFDYLPAGTSYVLVETKAPEGFAAAAPRLVTVEEENGLQLHEILNERKALALSKRSSATGKELSGASLAFYRADENGELNRSEKYLIASWISGTDGVYTEKDRINGRIPEGFQEGDLKPHYLYDLADGTYYLTEENAPDYYKTAEPQKVEYRGTENESVQIHQMTDEPLTGQLIVHKTDEKGSALSGAVFELTAREENGTIVSGFPKEISDINGIIRAEGLPVGKINPTDGSIEPYQYELKETVPPDGFSVNSEIYAFRFAKEGTEWEETIIHEIKVKNETTKIFLEKKELSSLADEELDGAFVSGAVMAVYRISKKGEDGDYVWTEEDLIETWTTDSAERGHLLKGLAGGRTYVLTEKKAPDGYARMSPVFFTVKRDGRGIASVSSNLSAITVNYKGEPGEDGNLSAEKGSFIDSVTFQGRTVVKTETAVLDEKGTEILRFTETGEEHILQKEDGLVEDGLYTFEEHTVYSDGSDTVTGRMTGRVHFDKDGLFRFKGRSGKGVVLSLKDSENALITEFEPEEEALKTTIMNPVNPEYPKITIRNRNGQEGEPLEKGQAVISTVAWYNPKHTPQDLTIRASVTEGMEVTDPYRGTLETDPETGNDTVVWKIHGAAPLEQGSVSFAASLLSENSGEKTARAAALAVTVETSGGDSFSAEKQVPVRMENCLTIFNELTGSGKEEQEKEPSRFTVRFWNKRGDELAGTYAYGGSREGLMRSGDTLELLGNEFITIDPVLKGCTYKVTRTEDGQEVKEYGTKGDITEEGAAAWFVREAKDPAAGSVFVKGNTYYLTETTRFSDGTEEISGRLSFSIGEDLGISVIGGYDKKTETVVEKTDLFTGQPIAGAKLELYRLSELPDEKERLIKEWTTKETPCFIEGLNPGERYRLKEAQPPEGYGYASDITFTVNKDGAAEHIRMEDRPTCLTVSKKDITNGEELPGARLQILNREGTVLEEWTSGETPHEVTGKLQADETYILREIIPADGFAIAGDISFTINHDGSVNYVEMKDDTTKVRIYKNMLVETGENVGPGTPSDAAEKQDSGSEKRPVIPVKGAILQILNEDKSPAVFQGKEMIFTTGETFALFEKQLKAGETYWIHEIKPAPGFGFSDDVKFTVSTDGRIDTVIMEDRQTKAVISKKTITGEKELPGCEMQLTDENGVIIDQWISGTKPHEITGVLEADHTYRLTEVNPAPGYAFAKDITFTVSHDGTVNQVEMRDDVTKAQIRKIDGKTGEPLAGARFQILDKTGAVLDSWISETEPHKIQGVLNAGESYILRELSAPPGYIKMEDVEFTANDWADVLTITVENRKKDSDRGETDYTIRLKKVDQNKIPLRGAAFLVTDGNGKLLDVEEEQGGTVFKVTLKTPQTIIVTEEKAPDGFKKLEKNYRIEIPREGEAKLLNGDETFYQDSSNSYVFTAVNKEEPKQPPEKEDRPDKGEITAWYDEELYGSGSTGLRRNGPEIPFVKTGDDFPAALIAAVFTSSAAGLFILRLLKRKRKRK